MRTQQERTFVHMNMQICSGWDCKDNWWPTIEPTNKVPKRLVTFQVSNAEEHKGDWCHFFIDDYRFERLWNQPERYIPILKRYKGVLSPDFSTYTDMPYPMQMWNVYRSRALAHYWQQHDIEVIPTLQWSDEGSYQFCFDGLPKGGTVAVSTVGVARSTEASELFVRGCQEAWMRTQFRTLLMYGKRIAVGLANNVIIRTYSNDNHDRVLRNQRKEMPWAEEAEALGTGRRKARTQHTEETHRAPMASQTLQQQTWQGRSASARARLGSTWTRLTASLAADTTI